jgi:hypothetical protein
MKMIIGVLALATALGAALVAPTAHASTGPTEAAYTHQPGTAMVAVRGATESENDAPALRGKWHVRATLLSRVHLGPLNNPDRTWIFKRACGNGHCVKRLLFELGAGGYEKFTLHRRNATTWEGRRRGVGVYCRELGRYVGRGVESVAIHITASQVVDGVRRATALEAYYRARYVGDCQGRPTVASEVARVRGTLVA